MKRRIIYGLVALATVIGIVWLSVYITSHQQLRYHYSNPIEHVTLYYLEHGYTTEVDVSSQKTAPAITIHNDTEITLKKGEYVREIRGALIQEKNEVITIADKKIDETLDFTYSIEHLKQLFLEQRSAIHQKIIEKHPTIEQLYTYDSEQVFDKGNWAVVIMSYIGNDASQRDSIRFILEKAKDGWVIRSGPSLAIDYASHADIPRSIIDEANREAYLPDGDTPTIHSEEFTSDEHEDPPAAD